MTEIIEATTEAELIAAVRDADDANRVWRFGDDLPSIPDGGAKRVIGDEPVTLGERLPAADRIIVVRTGGISVNTDGCTSDDLAFCGAVQATFAGGEPWDRFVEMAVDNGWVGVEALSGLGGSVASATIDNVAAYGQQVSDVVASVRTWDRQHQRQHTFAAADCGFGVRSSRFSPAAGETHGRYVVLDVAFLLKQGDLSTPITDPQLAELLDLRLGQRAPLSSVRESVLLNPDPRR